jgi:Cu(I)/Ag(I) efflux system periplasmic protein CusF
MNRASFNNPKSTHSRSILMKFTLNAILVASALALSLSGQVRAQQASAPASQSATAGAAAAVLTDGEVRKVDKGAKKVTIRHGEIRNLEMPAMTMVFAVSDSALLDKVKAGDKIRFKAVDKAGKLTVIDIEAAK